MPKRYDQVPLSFTEIPPHQMARNASEFCESMHYRRTVREFSERACDPEIIRNCIRAAGSAPSGANQQPWHFSVVHNDSVKRQIREAAEAEERSFYAGRASQEWIDAVQPLGTDANKPFLEIAPYLIVIFAQRFSAIGGDSKLKKYYVNESVGIATGILITALHLAGLATLTHTPAPMNFLNSILGRPENERPFLILVVGYPSDSATVPAIKRKPLDQISSWH